MKKYTYIGNSLRGFAHAGLLRGCIILASILISASSCKKDNPGPGGTTDGGGTTCTYVNNTFEPVNITINGQSAVINPGASSVFKGMAGTAAAGSAYTYGRTSSGTQVGLKIAWTISDQFPATGNFTNNLNVGTNFFFLKLVNNSAYQIITLYVNYGLVGQTLDNITVPNDGNTYNIGYYNAYSNSNVQAENGSIYWYWPTLNLSGSLNQSATLTAN